MLDMRAEMQLSRLRVSEGGQGVSIDSCAEILLPQTVPGIGLQLAGLPYQAVELSKGPANG